MVLFVDEQTGRDHTLVLEFRTQWTIVKGFRRARVTGPIGRITSGAR